MTRLLPKLLLLIVLAMVALPGHAGDELAGYWQHESDPVWIEMQPLDPRVNASSSFASE